jgi:hypothetical protein
MMEENVDGGWITKINNKDTFIPEGSPKPISKSYFVTRQGVNMHINKMSNPSSFKEIYNQNLWDSSMMFEQNIELKREVKVSVQCSNEQNEENEWNFTIILN